MPEGTWAMLAPLVILPLLAVTLIFPRAGAVLLIAVALTSIISSALLVARLGWLPGLGQLFVVLSLIAAIGIAIYVARDREHRKDTKTI